MLKNNFVARILSNRQRFCRFQEFGNSLDFPGKFGDSGIPFDGIPLLLLLWFSQSVILDRPSGPTKHRALPSVTARKCPLPRVQPEINSREWKVYGLGQFSWEPQNSGQLYTFTLSNGLIMFKTF